MSRKKIALYANVYETVVGQNITYMNFFALFGEVILVHSEMNIENVVKECDILALPGGMDLNSLSYGKSPGFESQKLNAHYEYLDKTLLSQWMVTNKPIIGICRGLQALNVALGGSLHRNIIGHVQEDKKGRDDTPDIMFTDIPGYQMHQINSYHHQAIDKLGEGLKVLGWGILYGNCPTQRGAKSPHMLYKHIYEPVNKTTKSPRRSTDMYACIAEIVKHNTKPYIAFQYHPEETFDELAISLINKTIGDHDVEKEAPARYPQVLTKGDNTYAL
jgi:gamma-glutamyl-gamma-aminobutyrate hydrolase PuuD